MKWLLIPALFLCIGCSSIDHEKAWSLTPKPLWVDNLWGWQQKYKGRHFIVTGETGNTLGWIYTRADMHAKLQEPRWPLGNVILRDQYIVHDGSSYAGFFLYEFVMHK